MDRLMTKTLAEIYLKQGHLQEAYEIFCTLAEKSPEDADLQKRVKELSEKLSLITSLRPSVTPTPPEKIRLLQQWLANIRERKKRDGKTCS